MQKLFYKIAFLDVIISIMDLSFYNEFLISQFNSELPIWIVFS